MRNAKGLRIRNNSVMKSVWLICGQVYIQRRNLSKHTFADLDVLTLPSYILKQQTVLLILCTNLFTTDYQGTTGASSSISTRSDYLVMICQTRMLSLVVYSPAKTRKQLFNIWMHFIPISKPTMSSKEFNNSSRVTSQIMK